jgi:hypothetical protein
MRVAAKIRTGNFPNSSKDNYFKSLDNPSFTTSIVRVFISCTLSLSQHVSALTKGHLQVILYNTKYLKESYRIISTDPLGQYYDNRQMPVKLKLLYIIIKWFKIVFKSLKIINILYNIISPEDGLWSGPKHAVNMKDCMK